MLTSLFEKKMPETVLVPGIRFASLYDEVNLAGVYLEFQLHAELDVSRRISACKRTERIAGRRCVQAGEVGDVESIEEVRLQAQVEPFSQCEAFGH